MKKILETLLAIILTIVILGCALIVLCGINPDVAKGASDLAKNAADRINSQNENEEDAASSTTSESSTEGTVAESLVDDIMGDVAATVASSTVIDITETVLSESDLTYSTTGLGSEIVDGSTSTYAESDSVIPDEPAVTDVYTDALSPEATVITLESTEEVEDCIKDASMGSTGNGLDFDADFYPYYQMLNDNCKGLYRQIYASARDFKTTFIPVNEASPSEWFNALDCVIHDHPELFWLDNSAYTEYDYKNKVVKVQLCFYDEEIPDIEAAQVLYNNALANILAGAADLKTDYEKEVYIHDYLAGKLTYNKGTLNQSAYSAIVLDETVCAGYSRGFQHLMQLLGIPTYYVTGWGGSTYSGGLHGWNMVKLDKSYYNVDVTWDDTEPVSYDYFNLSDSDFIRHRRKGNSKYLPACKGGKNSKSPVVTGS